MRLISLLVLGLIATGGALSGCGMVTTDGDAGRAGGSGGASDGGPGGAGGQGDGGLGSPCHSDQDCSQVAAFCLVPGQSPGCGICQMPIPCVNDGECQAQLGASGICDVAPCSCTAGTSCIPGCSSNVDCASWQSCGPDHRCVSDACTRNTDCPANFMCGGDGRCARKPCSSDGECRGACVKGACYDRPGACSLPAA